MKNKPDNRKNNAARIQRNISNTIQNVEMAEDMMNNANDKTKKELNAKNERRRDALEGMRSEIRDEANFQKKKGK
jgi:small acid-soluble spore protein (thioredoxin-like protein)